MNQLRSLRDYDKIINNTIIEKHDIREVYDNALKYQYGSNIPDEIRENDVYRYMVNHIRHKYSNYNKQVHILDLRCTWYYHRYKNEVLSKIAELYPSLEEECNKQKSNILIAKLIS